MASNSRNVQLASRYAHVTQDTWFYDFTIYLFYLLIYLFIHLDTTCNTLHRSGGRGTTSRAGTRKKAIDCYPFRLEPRENFKNMDSKLHHHHHLVYSYYQLSATAVHHHFPSNCLFVLSVKRHGKFSSSSSRYCQFVLSVKRYGIHSTIQIDCKLQSPPWQRNNVVSSWCIAQDNVVVKAFKIVLDSCCDKQHAWSSSVQKTFWTLISTTHHDKSSMAFSSQQCV